jgi:isoleucyl-tRNA synthetase
VTAGGTMQFALLPPDRPAAELETELLARWREEHLFERTLEKTSGGERFIFFEGPPTANGRPGIHHVFARTVKDLFCRHRAMLGYYVPRKAGWDTHGLPVEIEVEKQLGISGKPQIEEIGVEEFNRLCRESVFKYRAEWEELSERIAYWLDYARPYVTYTSEYIESVWWSLKVLHDRQLLYRGHKILPYCPRCGTTLSDHEVKQGYEDVEDPSVYVALELVEGSGTREVGGGVGEPLDAEPAPANAGASHFPLPASRRILVWTTTPWTLVSNVALAVNPELEYVEVVRRTGDDRRPLILAESRVAGVMGADWESRWEVVDRYRGTVLVGRRYRRPLDWVELPGGAEHEIIVGEAFVTAGDGSGVVHMAPAFGADDYAAGQRHGLAFVQPVGARGEFPESMPVVGGKFVKDADALIVDELRRRGVLFKAGTLVHPYPHCWRCGTPLLYYARTSWFIRTTAYKNEMMARNARVNWNPSELGTGRFGEWLENNIDWAVSRDRYWGTPLPVWLCDADETHAEAIGGYAELQKCVGRQLPSGFDPHKPFIDRYTWPCAKRGCTGTMRRVPEVIDAWYDSGSMSFAQWHYPFEHRDDTARHYPADFIAEGIDQTRGWFYSLLAIATGLGDALPNNAPSRGSRPDTAPYRSVVVNDLVLDAQGQKMSKSRGNVVDPWAVLERHGADAVRLFLVASSKVWVPRRFDESAIRELAGRFLRTLKNVYSGMFAQYANFGWAPSEQDPPPAARSVLDRWILSRLTAVEDTVDGQLRAFDATAAAQTIIQFVDDDVANWYVRLSRPRFYDVESDDNRAAFATLHEVLAVTCRLLAPICPFVTDWMHRELTGDSVHLVPFTRAGATGGGRDEGLETAMAAIRTLARLGRAAREEAGIKVRQPLSRLVSVAPHVDEAVLSELAPVLAGELNVKRVEFASSGDALVNLEAKPNFRSLGKKFGSRTPLAADAVAAFSGEELRALLRGEPLVVTVDGASHLLALDDLTIIRRATGALVVQEEGGFFAAVDPSLTPDLKAEGLARELVSRVQRMRKEAGLAVSDRIVLLIAGGPEVREILDRHGPWIAAEVLAAELVAGNGLSGNYDATQTVDLDGVTADVAITKVR